jgi:hypothetical protein
MPMAGPVEFLLNQGDEAQAKEVVEAPAFSLTKVLAAGAVVVAPIATLLVEQLQNVDLRAQHYVALAIGVLGFLAITAAADVLARSLAAAAQRNAEAAQNTAHASTAGIGQFIQFQDPLAAHQGTGTARSSVEVLAVAHAGEPYFLVKKGDSINWRPGSDITIP